MDYLQLLNILCVPNPLWRWHYLQSLHLLHMMCNCYTSMTTRLNCGILVVVSGISSTVIHPSLWWQKLVCQSFNINVGGVSEDASYPLLFQFRLQVFHHPEQLNCQRQCFLTLWRQNFLLNFSTPCF
jgi:hypothetical protein